MLWYGQIDVTTASVDWGSVLAGMDFDNGDAKETVAVNYVSNGNYDAAVATGGNVEHQCDPGHRRDSGLQLILLEGLVLGQPDGGGLRDHHCW